ncbi:MAG: single-strand binding protein [Frankiales bacterium]|nr:single-strand binding protein [Frankiales bacterium]
MNINQVMVAGNVVTQPVLEHVGQSETPKCTFRFAQTDRRRDSDGNWQDGDTLFVGVTCWRTVAENVYASVHKGDALLVAGKLTYDEWEKDGQRRSRHDLDAAAVGIDLSRQIATVKKARRTTPDTAPPSDGSTYGDGSADADREVIDELDELDAVEAGVPARV